MMDDFLFIYIRLIKFLFFLFLLRTFVFLAIKCIWIRQFRRHLIECEMVVTDLNICSVGDFVGCKPATLFIIFILNSIIMLDVLCFFSLLDRGLLFRLS